MRVGCYRSFQGVGNDLLELVPSLKPGCNRSCGEGLFSLQEGPCRCRRLRFPSWESKSWGPWVSPSFCAPDWRQKTPILALGR